MTNKKKIDQQELNFIDDVQQALSKDENKTTKHLLVTIFTFFVILLIWAALAEVDEVTVGSGKVIPSSKIRQIQSLEGGIIEKLYVTEGQEVQKDQPLVEIDDTQFASKMQERETMRNALAAKVARLNAEIVGKKKVVWPKIIQNKPAVIAIEQSLFNARMGNLNSNLKALDSRIELMKQELNLTRDLKGSGAVSKVELLQLESKMVELQNERDKLKADFIQKANKDLTDASKEYKAAEQLLVANKDKVSRSILKSPVHGTVKQVYKTSIGEVVKSGEDIMDIVPIDDKLLVEARIQPKDIGFIAKDQPVTVKLTAYDYSIYGGLEGALEHISADSLSDQKGNDYYLVQVKTDKNYLEHAGKKLTIIPGMVSSVHILTGRKTILDYLLKPILKTKENALRER